MPNYHGFHSNEIEMVVRPRGWRGFLAIGWLLRRWPYFTGSHPRFRITVKPGSNIVEANHLELNLRVLREGVGDPLYRKIDKEWLGKSCDINYDPPQLVFAGQHILEVQSLRLHENGRLNYEIGSKYIATFDAKSSDTLTLLIFGFLMSMLISATVGLLSVFGGFWVDKMFGDSSARPVYIVDSPTKGFEETQSPTPLR